MDILHKLPTGGADYNKKDNRKEEDFRHERSKREDGSCFWCDKIASLYLTDSVDMEGNTVKLCEKCKKADDESSKEIELMRCSEH
jgi:hypothetical protein